MEISLMLDKQATWAAIRSLIEEADRIAQEARLLQSQGHGQRALETLAVAIRKIERAEELERFVKSRRPFERSTGYAH